MWNPRDVVLDFVDDREGRILRDVFPEYWLIPDSVKTAMPLEKLEKLGDEHFALIFRHDGELFRKFAHPDPGHTILSTIYFMKNSHLLPLRAQEEAARGLVKAASLYGTPIPMEMHKKAFLGVVGKGLKAVGGMAAKNPIGTAMAGMTLYGTGSQIKDNLELVRSAKGNLLNFGQFGLEGVMRFIDKFADLTGTPHGPMPTQHPGFKRPKSFQPPLVQKRAMDLTGEAPPAPPSIPMQDTHFALQGRYPITDIGQVKMASQYFEDNARLFSPAERREYALNLCKRANQLGVTELLGETTRKYAGPPKLDLEQVKYAFYTRQQFLKKEEDQEMLDKIAEKLPYLHPEQRLMALAAFDKVANLERLYGSWLQDPVEALTDKWAEEAPFSEEIGGMVLSESELNFLAKAGIKELRTIFNDKVIHAFRANPVGTYKSLPKEQKILMARIAKAVGNDSSATSVPLDLNGVR